MTAIAGQARGRLTSCALLYLLTLAAGGQAHAQAPPAGLVAIAPLTARVTDLTGTLTAEQQNALEQKLAAFEAAKGAQIAVLVVPSTEPEDIAQFSIRVVQQWKLGRRKVDDGALLIIARNDHRVRIEVGYGLEGALPDAIANRIVTETVVPAFRQGNFYGGIDGGVEQMMKVIQGEELPAPQHQWGGGHSRHGAGDALPGLLFAVIVASVLLRAVFGRTLGSAFTGLGAGGLAYLAGYGLLLAGFAATGAFLFAMLAGLARGSGWSSGRYGGGGWGGGLGGGFGGGGGGGGFSGGGGGFGGGGASGSW